MRADRSHAGASTGTLHADGPTTARLALVYGASGHALVVADLLRTIGREVFCFVDGMDEGREGEAFGGARVRGVRALDDAVGGGVRDAFVAVGDNGARVRIARELEARGFRLPALVHPRAVVAEGAAVGSGAVVCANAVVGAGAAIGDYAIVNTAATVDHECLLGEGVHVSPGAHLGGGVSVGAGTWIGIGAVVRERVRIGARSIIGAGAAVVSDIPDSVVAYGVPARVVRSVS